MKTDMGKIQYPVGLCASDRRFARRLIKRVSEFLIMYDEVIVACSGGIDSTALVHAVGQANRILGNKVRTTAVYLNHHLRPEDVEIEAKHVRSLAAEYLTYNTPAISLDVSKGKSLQERARKARYAALSKLVMNIQEANPNIKIAVFLAHNMNDDAETKLFQFIRGMKEQPGIPAVRKFNSGEAVLCRPVLDFSRQDIERYVKCFGLTWCEDSSNATDKYTRNQIRHHLIPWIEKHINPGFVKMLMNMKNR